MIRVALDLRWLQQACLNSPEGGLGGIGSFSRNLWQGLAQSPADIQLVALLRRQRIAPALAAMIGQTAGARIAWVGRGPAFIETRASLRVMSRLFETEMRGLPVLARHRVDLLHTLDHTPPPRRSKIASVVTVYDLLGVAGLPPAGGWRQRFVADYQRRSICRFSRATAIAAISESTAASLRHQFPALADRVEVIPPGVRVGGAAGGAGTRGPLPSWLPRRYFLHVGLLTARKNPAGLIEGFRVWTRRHGREAGLVCVGPYEHRDGVRATVANLAKRHGLEDRVWIINAVSEPALAALYGGAEALVFPSFDEGFGMPLVESLACGTPCVGADQPVTHEAAGALGIYVDPRSSASIARGMERAGDAHHRRQVRRDGPAWSRAFSVAAMATRYLALYQRSAA